jgi:hypothetical protein
LIASGKCLQRLSNTLCQLLYRVINTLWKKIRGYWELSEKYVLFAKLAK